LDGAPEFLASNGSGKVYINLEDKMLLPRSICRRRKCSPVGP
jgi:hypothetical protein